MMKAAQLMLTIVCFLMAARSGRADSILVGSDLTMATNGGAGLCPSGSDCSLRAQQFTLFTSVMVDQIKIAVSGPYLFTSDGSFSVGLGGGLGSNSTAIGSGNIVFAPNQNTTTQVVDFQNLDILLGPGTYNLNVSGADLTWAYAAPLATSAGTLDQQFECDPTVHNCDSLSGWYPSTGQFGQLAMEIDGTTVPEPSSWLLFGTGLTGILCAGRRKLKRVTI